MYLTSGPSKFNLYPFAFWTSGHPVGICDSKLIILLLSIKQTAKQPGEFWLKIFCYGKVGGTLKCKLTI